MRSATWLCSMLAVGLTMSAGAAADDLTASVGTVYLYPSAMAGSVTPDANQAFDLGGNAWWLRDWAAFDAAKVRDAARLRELYDANPRTLLDVYFPLYLADTHYGTTYIAELDEVLDWFNSQGIHTMLFIGRPDVVYVTDTTQTFVDPTTDATQADYDIAAIQAILGYDDIASHAHLVSVYYMGFSAESRTTGDVLAWNQRLKSTINAFGPPGATCPADGAPACDEFIVHVDGPFWEAGYNNQANWNQFGYTPADISPVNSASDGLFAESWVQGSLPTGVQYLIDQGYFAADRILLVNDVPNCGFDANPNICATGDQHSAAAVASDNAQWFQWLDTAGVSAWSSWNYVDGAAADRNDYGRVSLDGTTLTVNGREEQRHAGIFLADFDD